MSRGRSIWLALLLVGFLSAWLLRTGTPSRPGPSGASAEQAARSRAAAQPLPSDEVEVELASPDDAGMGASPGVSPAAAATGVGVEPASEWDLLAAMRAAWERDPERALALAESGERRYGESPRAVERHALEIKALVKLGRIGSARSKAERFLAAYPAGPMTDEVERLTGVHRRPMP